MSDRAQTGPAPLARRNRSTSDADEAKAALRFRTEARRRMLINLSYLAISLAGAAFVISLFSGGRFASLMGYFGINMTNAKTGVYADCTKKENQHIPYCQPKEGRAEHEWRSLRGGKALPFNLSD